MSERKGSAPILNLKPQNKVLFLSIQNHMPASLFGFWLLVNLAVLVFVGYVPLAVLAADRVLLAEVAIVVDSEDDLDKGALINANEPACLQEIGAEVNIEGRNFMMGNDHGYAEEGPAFEVRVSSFWIDRHEITNGQFDLFVTETGYITVAEQQPRSEDWPSVPIETVKPGSTLFVAPANSQGRSHWWLYVAGTNWRHPAGPDSNIEGRENYPVVHIAFEDAKAYADWAGRSLPTEAQFELAAQRRHSGSFTAAGDELVMDGQHQANTWQGLFPYENTNEDQFQGLAPVGCFNANDYGVYDLIGNVWEWTANWYAPGHLSADRIDPTGPGEADSYSAQHGDLAVKVIKGGSYLCAPNYCMRFRPAARQAADTGLGTSHIGFRTVRNH
ncbi:MAG: formylglycine-generating enzyme family protein [Pseudomonadales bacterium]|nr:formylglycine-generating enzyme family protein [Pseudomonadales bacterium]